MTQIKRALISWTATQKDFLIGQPGIVNDKGPTHSIHLSDPWPYDIHVILSAKGRFEEEKGGFLVKHLNRYFEDHLTVLREISIQDIFGYEEILGVVRQELRRLSKSHQRIDILFSNGTTVMRAAWVLAHIEGQFPTHLIQGVEPNEKVLDPSFREIQIEQTQLPTTLQVYHELSQDPKLIKTGIIEPIYKEARQIAKTPVKALPFLATLIRGQSGTGKELLARHIHDNSIRNKRPYKPINCAAIPDDLLATELFGYEKGAFTDAKETKKGLFEEANGGTIFLDEIGDISGKLQASLLRVLQEREVRRVGGTAVRPVDVRIIAATNQPLEELCRKGKFRWDLYFRLATTELYLPPLREYPLEDFKRLLTGISSDLSMRLGRQEPLKFSEELLLTLTKYDYPGNIRELQRLLTNLYIFSGENATLSDLPGYLTQKLEYRLLPLQASEKAVISRYLSYNHYNLTKTARALKISPNTLGDRIKKYRIEIPGKRNKKE